ncbi:MAG TPA: hypothetical protein VNN25_28535 [Thermoanaerobaculia bacterium]|nr:hypothetical protein [Thermoanaerobaculia bacterium]
MKNSIPHRPGGNDPKRAFTLGNSPAAMFLSGRPPINPVLLISSFAAAS